MIIMLSNGEYSGHSIVGLIEAPEGLKLEEAHKEFTATWMTEVEVPAKTTWEYGMDQMKRLIERYVPKDTQEEIKKEYDDKGYSSFSYVYDWEYLFMYWLIGEKECLLIKYVEVNTDEFSWSAMH